MAALSFMPEKGETPRVIHKTPEAHQWKSEHRDEQGDRTVEEFKCVCGAAKRTELTHEGCFSTLFEGWPRLRKFGRAINHRESSYHNKASEVRRVVLLSTQDPDEFEVMTYGALLDRIAAGKMYEDQYVAFVSDMNANVRKNYGVDPCLPTDEDPNMGQFLDSLVAKPLKAKRAAQRPRLVPIPRPEGAYIPVNAFDEAVAVPQAPAAPEMPPVAEG